jgi:transcriptional antiterminator RfaH
MTVVEIPIAEVEEKSVADFVGDWVVIYCEPEREWRVVREIGERDQVPFFRPMQTRIRTETHRGNKRRRRLIRPLFAGYISFCCETNRHRKAIASHDDVVRIISVSNQRRFRIELGIIEDYVGDNSETVTFPVSETGQRCRVKSGAYRGFEGKLIRIQNETKFHVEIETFGRLVPLEIDPADLEPI